MYVPNQSQKRHWELSEEFLFSDSLIYKKIPLILPGECEKKQENV